MGVPFSVVIIKPLSIGRGDGPSILKDILNDCNVTLRHFRPWCICHTTLKVLYGRDRYKDEIPNIENRMSWICLFTHVDRHSDPFIPIYERVGPEEIKLWTKNHIRYKYSAYKARGKHIDPSDTVVHISSPERSLLEAELLFTNFKESCI